MNRSPTLSTVTNICILASASVFATGQAHPTWKRFEPADGRFSVRMFGAPRTLKHAPTVSYVSVFKDKANPEYAVVVGYTETPKPPSQTDVDHEKAVAHQVGVLAGGFRPKSLKVTRLTMVDKSGYHGFSYFGKDGKGGAFRGEILRSKRRLYFIFYYGASFAEAKTFLLSLKIVDM